MQDRHELFWIDKLAAGASQQAELLPGDEARRRYMQLINANYPVTPVGFTTPRESNSNLYYYNNNFDGGFGSPEQATNLMEQELTRPADLSDPSRRVYFAVLLHTPEHLPVAVPGCRQEAGFHVVHGEW